MPARTTRKPTPRQESLPADYAKMPPQAIELEEAVLGAIMLEKNALLSVIDILKPESFYKEAHQKIFQAILDLSMAEKPIDILTVTEQLRTNKQLDEAGGPAYISQLTTRIASAAHIEYHARIVAQKYIQRELIRVSSEIQKQAYDESIDVNDLLEFSEKELFEIATGNIKKESLPVNTILKEAIRRIEEASKRSDNLSGVPSGFTKLDRITSGWQRSDLVIIAARPSMGKTAFVLSMARNMAVEHKIPVAIFSLEMSSVQLVNRMIVSETELPSERIKNGKLTEEEWKQLDAGIRDLVHAPLYIDDTPAISIYELRAKCRRLVVQHQIQVVIVDYLQLMTAPVDAKGSREQEVSMISRSLKALAKELDVPVIALSQLNRSVETRSGTKRPQLSDLRESGAIEQDADIVIFIHRPEKYGLFEDLDGNSTKGIAEIIVAKHRNGPTADIQLRFRDDLARFEDLDTFAPIDTTLAGKTVTIGSRMNQDVDERYEGKFTLGRNDSFDQEIPY